MVFSQVGKLVSGNIAPERPNIGKIMKFIINWKPCISSIFDAIAIPSAVKHNPISNMKIKAIINPDTLKMFVPNVGAHGFYQKSGYNDRLTDMIKLLK